MTITPTKEMIELLNKFAVYLVWSDEEHNFVFKDDTPEEILELEKEYDRLYQEQYEFELSMLF